MDRFQYKQQAIKIGAIAGGAFFFILVIFNFAIVNKKSANLNKIKQEIVSGQAKLQSYSSFETMVNGYDSKKDDIRNNIQLFYDNLVQQDKIEQRCLEEIGKITKAAGIKIDKMTPIGASLRADSGYEKQVWKISFVSSYKKLYKFIYLLENNKVVFGIDLLQIFGGGENKMHSVEMDIYTITSASVKPGNTAYNYSVSNSTNIFKLPADALGLMEKMNQKKTEIAVSYEVKVDPLSYAGTIFPKKRLNTSKKNKKYVPSKPNLKLEGIIWDDQNPMVIINGKVLGKGGRIDGAKITKITKTYVSVWWRSKTFTLKLTK
jgi:hypothetical protein